MHEALMQVPNMLFYNNQIKSGYTPSAGRKFMNSDAPFLFIDVSHGREQLKGTSFCNMAEVEVINSLKRKCLE